MSLNLAPAAYDDYRRLAERRLPRALFDYLDGGAGAEATMNANVDDMRKLVLRQRVMRDVSNLDVGVSLFGESWAMPVALAPIGMGGMMRRRAETQAARAAAAAGVPFCLSTVSICSLEEVAAATSAPFWFQLYVLKDRAVARDLLARAQAVGVRTLVFTVDLPVVGARRRDIRNGLSGGGGAYGRFRSVYLDRLAHSAWLVDVGLFGQPHVFGNIRPYIARATTPSDFRAWIDNQFDASVTWADIEKFRKDWNGAFIVKGVLTAEDARAAIDAGADGVVVSNHGGRQLDGVSSTIRALPPIADALAGRAKILIDGGVRSGEDVVRALASGADAALIGRPWIYAIAAQGEAGLARYLVSFKRDISVAMALTGAARVSDIGAATLDRA